MCVGAAWFSRRFFCPEFLSKRPSDAILLHTFLLKKSVRASSSKTKFRIVEKLFRTTMFGNNQFPYWHKFVGKELHQHFSTSAFQHIEKVMEFRLNARNLW
jgi:hypothetical protein